MSNNTIRNCLVIIIIISFLSAFILPNINGNINPRFIEDSENEIKNNQCTIKNKAIYYPFETTSWPMFHNDLENTGYINSNAPDEDILKWSFNLGNSVSSPVISDGKVYVGESMSKIYCLNANTGGEIWSYASDDGIYFSAPAVYDGKLYFNEADEFVCLNANNGNYIWSYSPCGGWSSPAVFEGKVYFGSDNDNVYCLNAYNGNFIWSYQTGDNVKSSPAIDNGKLYIGSDDDYVYCLDADTGEEIWSFLTGDKVQSSPAVANNKVYVGSADGYMYCINADSGSEIWSYAPCCVKISSPAIAYGKVYAGTTCDASLYCLDADTGEKLWRFQTNDHIWSAPAVADGKVYFGSLDSKIYCLFAETGIEIWSRQTGANIITAPAIANENLFIGSNDGKLYCFTSENQIPIPLFDWDPNYPQTGESVDFDASDSYDTDGSIVQYEWDWNDDGIFDESHTTADATHVWYEAGIHPVTLRVTDNDGGMDTLTKNVYIGIIPPVADFTWSPETPEPDETVTFDASDSYDPDGSIVLYEWDWNDDGTYDESSTNPTIQHVWSEEGTYSIVLRVTDDDDLTDTKRKVISIGVIPPIAFFDWSPQVPQSGKIVTFDATGSYDPDGTIQLYEWDWDNDGIYDESSTNGIIQHTWFEYGDYPVTLKVTDNTDAYDTVTNIIHVINRAPFCSFEWSPNKPFPGETTTFDASGSYDPDGVIVLYEWDWDDDGTYDESTTSPTATQVWQEEGIYSVTLRVTDNNNKMDRATKTLQISGETITNANWGDSNYSGAKVGSFLSYKLKEWHGHESSNNKAWAQVDLNVWFPSFNKNIHNRSLLTNIFSRGRTPSLPIFQTYSNLFSNIISALVENIKKSDRGGRHGLSWASVGISYIAPESGTAQVTLEGSLNGKFSTDFLSGTKVDNWVTATLHIVEKDNYIPEENEGESITLYSYNFTSDKQTINVELDKGFEVSLNQGTEYLIFLKLKSYASLSPNRPILDGFFSSSAFGKQSNDINGAQFSFIGIQFQ
jgi:outer membrane protein assembly factor BamB